jgi:hypothetical protein
MTYISADQSPESEAWVIYQSKDGTTTKTFHALDWLARLTTHIPNKNEQMVRYYSRFHILRLKKSNVLSHIPPSHKKHRMLPTRNKTA